MHILQFLFFTSINDNHSLFMFFLFKYHLIVLQHSANDNLCPISLILHDLINQVLSI